MKTEPIFLIAKTDVSTIRTCARWNMLSGEFITSPALGRELVQAARNLALPAKSRGHNCWSPPAPLLSAADLKAMSGNEWIRYAMAENQGSSAALLEALTHDTNAYVQLRAKQTIDRLRNGHLLSGSDQGRA